MFTQRLIEAYHFHLNNKKNSVKCLAPIFSQKIKSKDGSFSDAKQAFVGWIYEALKKIEITLETNPFRFITSAILHFLALLNDTDPPNQIK